MDLHEAMRTTFAARDFTADPVPDAALLRRPLPARTFDTIRKRWDEVADASWTGEV